MYAYKDFANFFGVSTRTIHRKLEGWKSVLVNFQQNKRKRLFTDDEAEMIMTELKRHLKIKDKRPPKSLSDMYNSSDTTA